MVKARNTASNLGIDHWIDLPRTNFNKQLFKRSIIITNEPSKKHTAQHMKEERLSGELTSGR